MADEQVAAVASGSKSESFEDVIRRRIENWRYLKRAHEGSLHWMNIVALTREDIVGFYTDPKLLQKRAEEWFCMGISIAPLLQRAPGLPFISALQQFWDEFESYFGYGSVAEKGLKLLKKEGKEKEILNTPNIPSQLDYFQIVFTLCDLLVHVYEKFANSPVNKEVQVACMKVDARFKTHVVNVISKDLTTLALNVAKTHLGTLEGLYSK